MSGRYVALLRGVNVGGRHRVPMAALGALFESLGHAEVTTYIQSGNVLFTAARRPRPAVVEAACTERFGMAVRVVVLTPAELEAAMATHPFAEHDPGRRHVGFLAEPAAPGRVATLEGAAFMPDEFSLCGEVVHLHLPGSMARTKLPAYLERRLGVPITFRNWNTVSTLAGLASGAAR